jgi:hypothetical protein
MSVTPIIDIEIAPNYFGWGWRNRDNSVWTNSF